MARPKATINSVDMTRAIKTLKSAGLSICSTKVGPDGTVTFIHGSEGPDVTVISADDALARWEDCRQTARYS